MSTVNVMHTEFAAQLRSVGVSQAAFARLCGVTTIAVNHWCRGRRAVPQWAWALALALEAFAPPDLQRIPDAPWYDVLGVSPRCDLAAASAARGRLAKKYHPDIGGTVDAMQRINAALDTARRMKA